ncbi:MAG: hypothetical protein Kow00108_09220 [Calditrichia bacterium]
MSKLKWLLYSIVLTANIVLIGINLVNFFQLSKMSIPDTFAHSQIKKDKFTNLSKDIDLMESVFKQAAIHSSRIPLVKKRIETLLNRYKLQFKQWEVHRFNSSKTLLLPDVSIQFVPVLMEVRGDYSDFIKFLNNLETINYPVFMGRHLKIDPIPNNDHVINAVFLIEIMVKKDLR